MYKLSKKAKKQMGQNDGHEKKVGKRLEKNADMKSVASALDEGIFLPP